MSQRLTSRDSGAFTPSRITSEKFSAWRASRRQQTKAGYPQHLAVDSGRSAGSILTFGREGEPRPDGSVPTDDVHTAARLQPTPGTCLSLKESRLWCSLVECDVRHRTRYAAGAASVSSSPSYDTSTRGEKPLLSGSLSCTLDPVASIANFYVNSSTIRLTRPHTKPEVLAN